VSVLLPSLDRVEPPCPLHGSCGGCALMSLAYPAQLEWKRGRVAQEFARHPALAGVPVHACVASPVTTGYRNQAKYVYGRIHDSRQPVLGAFAPRSHAVVDLAGCRVVEPALDKVAAALFAVLLDKAVEPFDEIRRTSVLRYVVMRATGVGRVMVTLVSARPDWRQAQEVADALVAACPAVVSVVLNVNASAGNAIFGDEERLLWGQSTVEDCIGDVSVRLSSRSFFQANRLVASLIYRDLAAAAPARVVRAVDVYSGAAPIALSLAPMAEEVVAIEENCAATQAAAAFIAELAARGESLCGAAGRVRTVTGDAAQCLARVDSADLVVLNPPRKGCAPPVLAAISRLRPKDLAYLSCDLQTLARDLAVLATAGWQIVRVTPYDMLPHTPHVETLVLLRPA
jgi:23S rRNA (uracil1939-C5)-methyltransferase